MESLHVTHLLTLESKLFDFILVRALRQMIQLSIALTCWDSTKKRGKLVLNCDNFVIMLLLSQTYRSQSGIKTSALISSFCFDDKIIIVRRFEGRRHRPCFPSYLLEISGEFTNKNDITVKLPSFAFQYRGMLRLKIPWSVDWCKSYSNRRNPF